MTLIYTTEAGRAHETPVGHPERVDRLDAVRQGLSAARGPRIEAPVADDADVLRCHPARYLAALREAVPERGSVALDADTHLAAGTMEAALRAVGGACAAVDAVLAGEARTAFVGCRPPGHHAEAEVPMGFCLFGTAAIAAKRALDAHGLSRVAVLDFDVHHGNGTQALLWDEARTLFVSSHQSPLWPGSGAARETGARDNVINLPLPPGSGGAEMRRAWEREAFPALDDFRPELVIVSAGFDAHARDPLANLNWTEEDFAWITGAICDLAGDHAAGRVVSTLEGGYDLPALAASVAAHVGVLEARDG